MNFTDTIKVWFKETDSSPKDFVSPFPPISFPEKARVPCEKKWFWSLVQTVKLVIGLITHLGREGKVDVVALDVQPLDDSLRPYCLRSIQGDILDGMLLGRLVAEFEIRTIYHLASILSTKAEYNPETAHRVNVEGTLNLLRLAVEQSGWQGRPVKFIYPSSIAAYGLPNLETKLTAGKIKEWMWLEPTTMYGCNKLYCEHLGRYYTRYYRQLAADHTPNTIDFRCIRFPGLISADTIPTGGTSDYGPECFIMPHKASLMRALSVLTPVCLSWPCRMRFVAFNAGKRPQRKFETSGYNVTSFSDYRSGNL